MRFRFRPVDNSFFELFAESANHLIRGAGLLAEMLGESADHKPIAKQMRAAELAADETTHAIINKVNSVFVTPFDREDIYALVGGLDDIMDYMDEAVDQILVYDVKVMPEELSVQVDLIQRCAELTAAAIPRLRSPRTLEEFWIEINRLENQGDKNHRRVMARLFSGEFKAMEVLKIKDIAESLEDAIDGFEKIANIVEQIAVKDS